MNLAQRRRFVGGALVLVVLIAVIVGLVAKGGNPPSNDRASLHAWYVGHGKQDYESTAHLFDALLTGLDHAKVDNGGPGILAVKPTCQEGATGVSTFLQAPPPSSDPLSTTYTDMMNTGSEVFAHCLEGIAATSITTSKLKVNLMLAEMTTYSQSISTFGRDLSAAGL
jgi:hypothetical protein